MAHRVTHAGLTVLHDAPAEDAKVLHAGLVVLHDAPASDAVLIHAGLVVMHGLQVFPVLPTGVRQIQRIDFTGRSIVRWPKR